MMRQTNDIVSRRGLMIPQKFYRLADGPSLQNADALAKSLSNYLPAGNMPMEPGLPSPGFRSGRPMA